MGGRLRRAIGRRPHHLFDAADYETRIAGEVKDFDPVAQFGRKEARRMARLTATGAGGFTEEPPAPG